MFTDYRAFFLFGLLSSVAVVLAREDNISDGAATPQRKLRVPAPAEDFETPMIDGTDMADFVSGVSSPKRPMSRQAAPDLEEDELDLAPKPLRTGTSPLQRRPSLQRADSFSKSDDLVSGVSSPKRPMSRHYQAAPDPEEGDVKLASNPLRTTSMLQRRPSFHRTNSFSKLGNGLDDQGVDGYGSDVDEPKRPDIKRPDALTKSPTLQRTQVPKKKGFVTYSTPKVFQAVCDYDKVLRNDPDMSNTCMEQCIDLSRRVEDVYYNHPQTVGIQQLFNECSGFTMGSCQKSFDIKNKKGALCNCLQFQDEKNFKSSYAGTCRAGLSGLKIITNIKVATDSVRKVFRSWRAKAAASRERKKRGKASQD